MKQTAAQLISNFTGVKVGTSGNLAYYVPSWSQDVSFAGITCRYTMQDYYFADSLKCSGISNAVVRPVVSYSCLYSFRDVAGNFKGVEPRVVQINLDSLGAKIDSEGLMKQ